MIVKVPNLILKTKCKPVDFAKYSPIYKRLKKEWEEYQAEHKDEFVVGLAAPQIGIDKNVFIAFGDVFINPRIVKVSSSKMPTQEGCCSLDGIYSLERPVKVQLVWTDRARRLRQYTFRDSQAAVILHEMDHLRGIIISDKGVKL